MNSRVFQVTDLANNRTEFIDEARNGMARLRDKDGTSLVMLPEARLDYLQKLQDLVGLHLRVNHLVTAGRRPSVKELGDHSWLRVFDLDDLKEFTQELEDALIAARGDENTEVADEVLAAWRLTAKQLSDPLRRSVLLEPISEADLVDATRPADTDDAEDVSDGE
ncbi:hypothetical protein ACFXPS_05520 [Nocardia sp. NPDC059091]|uniref:hypothetical protein n=1 Tax=unclassified Nocardia TaxID=2637762 RepID=UPI00369F89D1